MKNRSRVTNTTFVMPREHIDYNGRITHHIRQKIRKFFHFIQTEISYFSFFGKKLTFFLIMLYIKLKFATKKREDLKFSCIVNLFPSSFFFFSQYVMYNFYGFYSARRSWKCHKLTILKVFRLITN